MICGTAGGGLDYHEGAGNHGLASTSFALESVAAAQAPRTITSVGDESNIIRTAEDDSERPRRAAGEEPGVGGRTRGETTTWASSSRMSFDMAAESGTAVAGGAFGARLFRGLFGQCSPPPRSTRLRGAGLVLEELCISANATATHVDECAICLAPLIGLCASTACGHRFHADCIDEHLQMNMTARCPLCRGALRPPLPVSASARSGRPIDVVARPQRGGRCHHDRDYRFVSLGGFASLPHMLYLVTSNDDKRTTPDLVMWTLKTSVPAIVYLNFRSERHLVDTGAIDWLCKDGWERSRMRSSVSTGFPSWLYWGPVFSKTFSAGTIELMGSNCAEGTYFVFVQMQMDIAAVPESRAPASIA